MFNMKLMFVLVACLYINILQVNSDMTCEPKEGVEEFDHEKYAGTWYIYCDSEGFFKYFGIEDPIVSTELKGDTYVGNITYKLKRENKIKTDPTTRKIIGSNTLEITNGEDLDITDGKYKIIAVNYTSYNVVRGNPEAVEEEGTYSVSYRTSCPTEDDIAAVSKICKDFEKSCIPVRNCPKS